MPAPRSPRCSDNTSLRGPTARRGGPAAGTARMRLGRRRPRDLRRSTRRRVPPGPPARCPARSGSSCRSRTCPPVRGGRPVIATAFRTAVPRSERRTAPPGGARTAPGSRLAPSPPRPWPGGRRVPRSWTARITPSSCAVAGITSAPADLSASSRTAARSGTSVPGSQTPSHTSPSGSCSRQSLCHTAGSRPRWAAVRNDQGVTRAAELGIRIGILPSGPTGSIVDVPGVGVGHATVWRDDRRRRPAAEWRGPASR